MTKSKKPPRAYIKYSKALADRICSQLKDGKSLREICAQKGYPTEAAIRGWVMDDYMGFSSQYTRAREIGYSRLAEEILQIANTPVLGVKKTSKALTSRNPETGDMELTGATQDEVVEGDMIEHRKLQVDTRKWILSKMLPKVYGDKQQVELTGKVDIAGGLLAARKRAGLAND